MIKPINAILFATDLTSNCQQALDFTLGLGARYNATVYLLHVVEKVPENVEGRLKELLGKHQWDDIVNTQQQNVHRSLAGKTSINRKVRQDIQNFCKTVGIDDEACQLQSREIIISAGDIAENIVAHAVENKCDVIVLGAKNGILSKNSIGLTIKTVLKNSKIPVTIAPAV